MNSYNLSVINIYVNELINNGTINEMTRVNDINIE